MYVSNSSMYENQSEKLVEIHLFDGTALQPNVNYFSALNLCFGEYSFLKKIHY